MNHPELSHRAVLLDTNFTALTVPHIKKEVELLRILRPNLTRYVDHTSLNFLNADILDNNRLLMIAHDYLRESGYTNNQYLIFRHFDAAHPHLHLVVNRISFDGSVVTDRYNYQRSEAILRKLEHQYNLVILENCGKAAVKSPSINELEMVARTGKPSEKMVLQEKLKKLLEQQNYYISEFIRKAEEVGIDFLFNQGPSGKVAGITYFHNGFKIRGRSLGDGFKWQEVEKQIDYEQDRDGKTISQTNSRTKLRYQDFQSAGAFNAANRASGRGTGVVPGNASADAPAYDGAKTFDETKLDEDGTTRELGQGDTKRLSASQQSAHVYNTSGDGYNSAGDTPVAVSCDVENEPAYGNQRPQDRQAIIYQSY